MKNDRFLNEKEIRKTVAMLKAEGQLFEVRIISGDKRRKISGYFRDADTMLEALKTIDLRDTNVYMTLNIINESCYSRAQHDRFRDSANTTADNDIDGYQWMLVDLDPIRATGISSSEDEIQASKELAGKVYKYLQGLGFEEPVKAMSGNGCHLLYKVSLQNNEENERLIRNCLKVLSDMFSTDKVAIDTVNYNPARICKLHGTLAQKGASTEDRPHRMSYIFTTDFNVKPTDVIYLKKLAAELQEDEKPVPRQYSAAEFDLLDFMSRNGLRYESPRSGDGCTIYPLEECPFDASHTHGDAKIFHYNNGAIAFKCHHNHCNGYKWQDVRMKFEPEAYERNNEDQRIDEGWKQHNRNKSKEEVSCEIKPDVDAFRNAKQIISDPEPDNEYVVSGITVIDQKLHGLEKTRISVISGLRASGKSTILGQMMLSAIDNGSNVICYSGELANKKYLKWLIRQAAGKANIEVSTKYKNGYGVSDVVEAKIVDWLGDHFWLYDNKCGNDFKKISEVLVAEIRKRKADLCVIDNLMALDLSTYDKDKYEAQTKFMWKLKEIAEITNTHILFVAHPRKSTGFLRLDDISGTGNIGNIIDNAFIVHRNNRDFQRLSQEYFDFKPTDDIYQATNVIEIAKDRENGLQDEFVPLYFEEQTKRLRNSKDENVVFGWDTENDFIPEETEAIPF